MRTHCPRLGDWHCAALACGIGLALGACPVGCADVIVLANRTAAPISARFVPVSGAAQILTLDAGETAPVFLDGKAKVTFTSNGALKSYALDANCAYFFGRSPAGRIDLQKIGLGEDGTATDGRHLPGSASGARNVMIPVKILVDEEEPSRQAVWERRLRGRVAAASAILERYCGVGFQVVAIGTWKSDNAITDFFDSLAEFERKVDPSPARLAIGFTSQWQMVHGRTHMAGTRGPLHSHILVREGSPEIDEPERLEFLVHELGHYLGAAHSPEPQSVMRPVLGDNRAGRSDFRIQFDPVNALAIAMVGEEMRRANVRNVSQLKYATRRRLEQIYRELARAIPDDPAAAHYAMLMHTSETPLAAATRQVVQQIMRAAVENRALPPTGIVGSTERVRREGDALTEYYVRAAARTANALPVDVARQSFLLGLAIGLDNADTIARLPGMAEAVRSIEQPSQRTVRLTVLGEPTLRGRADLARHFFTFAYMGATAGPNAARDASLKQELASASRPEGFSFKFIAADMAGIRFGQGVASGQVSLGSIARQFGIASFMPEIAALPEGMGLNDLRQRYGKVNDPRFEKQLQAIDERLVLLPGYRATP
ncbi:MAG TPA: matrixin family metalloprotease [Lacipirellulaceae bacterium]|nr:matrixin family metalloprotease [Lacipirellulaceae bacterium]